MTNFAVIEYTSKSGDIWRHTPERPNYLADPHHEMDPTSFGCYVSALAGEHIPIMGLITGPVNQVPGLQKTTRKVVKRVTGRWPTYSLDYFKKFQAVLVVHQISDGFEVTRFTQRLKTTYPHLTILGVPTQPFGLLEQHIKQQPAFLDDLQAFMASCDIFVSIVEQTVPIWQTYTTTPVIYLPQPYPVDYARRLYKPLTDKEHTIIVEGVTSRPQITRGHTVAVALQQLFPDYLIKVVKVEGLPLDLTELAGSRYEVLPFEEWQEHLQTLARARLVINTDFTLTRGRVQVDCAAVGTVSLGSNSDGQRDLFPDLFADSTTSLTDLIDLGQRVLVDDAYYQSLIDKSLPALEQLTYEVCAKRLQTVLKTHQRYV